MAGLMPAAFRRIDMKIMAVLIAVFALVSGASAL
jgi:hypothetical protein